MRQGGHLSLFHHRKTDPRTNGDNKLTPSGPSMMDATGSKAGTAAASEAS